jgi:hypothetical protein
MKDIKKEKRKRKHASSINQRLKRNNVSFP